MAELTFLLVDDAAFIRDLVKKAVRSVYPGCELLEAVNGRKAVSQMNSHQVDVVLCDWEMPEMSGLEVLQWMRSDVRYSKTPFMMITSRGDRDHVVAAVEAGVSDYIGKPFTRDALVTKLTKLVYRHLKIKPPTGAEAGPAAIAGDRSGASVLMGAAGAAQARPAPRVQSVDMAAAAPPLLKKTAPARAPAASGGRTMAQATVRFASGLETALVIKDMNLQELIGIFRREDLVPQLLEQVVVDVLDPAKDSVARVNGFVRMMQAQEPHPDAETIQIRIRYVDDDPDKLETLSRFIARMGR
ncbi:response regulator [Parathalassolituus penaei]|uniref:Response regulator n=1 Tax=Parathalassolituus penaei TaxID=2997323 RepID=A0A9X3IU19_9GAMM|nr:response regulator [Parathalassolituus penaei]MCY0965723.1 response regulator [Parathalassolituus penaei]